MPGRRPRPASRPTPAGRRRPSLARSRSLGRGKGVGVSVRCSGDRAEYLYNRIRVRLRTPKYAKLELGASAVHVRSLLRSHFFGVGH